MSEWKELEKEYRHYKKELEVRKAKLTEDDPEYKIYVGMINDMDYAIRWLVNGYEPDSYTKSIRKKGGYEGRRNYYADIDRLSTKDVIPIFSDHTKKEKQLTDTNKKHIQRFLSTLTDKQLNAFVQSAAYNRSFGEIASEMGVSKNTVVTHIEAARKKATDFQRQLKRGVQ